MTLVLVLIAAPVGPVHAGEAKGKKIYLRYYYPIGVAGALAKAMQEMVDEFNEKHEGIVVEAIYAGDYVQTIQKLITAVIAKRPPDLAMIGIEDLGTLLAMNALVPLDDFIAREGGRRFLDDFFPGLMANSYSGGKVWSIPFQRSTPVFYWNKNNFREAGLDPERPPKNWDELREYARKLTIRDGESIKRYGLIIPGTWYDWTLEGFVRQNGGELMDPEGKRIQFNSPQALEALEFWVELAQKEKVMPPVSTWGATPPDFVAGRTSMLYHSTGSLRFFTDSVKFPFGVGFLPGRKSYGTPVGGANFHILRGTPPENQKAAWTFITWVTNTENAAKWSIASGYIAVRKSAYDTAAMKEYAQKVPGILVARDHLEYAHPRMGGPNFTKARINLVTRVEEALTGRLTARQALDLVQKETLEIMRGK